MLACKRGDQPSISAKITRVAGKLPGQQTPSLCRQRALARERGAELVAEGALQGEGGEGSAQP
jgi:hypothetical protein